MQKANPSIAKPVPKKFKGSALLTALFIMTLVAIVATAMSAKIQLNIYHEKTTIAHDKVYLASQAVTFWAVNELSNKKNNFMHATDQGMVSQYSQDKGSNANAPHVSGALYDLQSRYNLNNLSNKKLVIGFVNLLSTTTPKLNDSAKIQLALAVNNWLSPYELSQGKDAYLSYYMSQKPPFYPSHQLMACKTELRLVKNIDRSTYLALEPYVTALPEITTININTAPLAVLKSLSTVKNDDHFDDLISARKKGIKNVSKIAEVLKKLNIAHDQITLESSYFLSVADVSSENLHLTVYTVFKKSKDPKGKTSVTVLRESFNTF